MASSAASFGTCKILIILEKLYRHNARCDIARNVIMNQSSNSIQIWTAVECNGATYCTVVTSYCQRPKLLMKPSYFLRAFRPEENMTVEGVIFGRGQYDVTAVH